MSAFWCERAWLGGERPVDGVVVTVAGGRIAAVGVGAPAPPPGAIRLDGLTLPGFANSHSHAFHRALRGRTHTGGGTFWTWRDRMYALAGTLDPDRYEELATAAFAEMVLAGYTCVGEFHYVHHRPDGAPYGDRNELGRRMITAAARAGIRLTLLDTLYLSAGFGVEPSGVQRRFSDGSARRWIERIDELVAAPSERCAVGAAIHSVRAVDPAAMTAVSEWADAEAVVVHVHVSEQPKENEDCRAAHGCTPTELLNRCGVLGDRLTAVHATHLTESDVELLAITGSRCCICPTTERELADGIGPTSALRAAGVKLCVGSDSHAVIDPFEEVRAIELDERLASLRRGTHAPVDLLTAGTREGYRSLGWDAGGVIEEGALADLVTIGFDSPRLAGVDADDPLGSVVFAAGAGDVRHVVVAGEHVVDDGVHQRLDVAAALRDAIAAAWKPASQ